MNVFDFIVNNKQVKERFKLFIQNELLSITKEILKLKNQDKNDIGDKQDIKEQLIKYKQQYKVVKDL